MILFTSIFREKRGRKERSFKCSFFKKKKTTKNCATTQLRFLGGIWVLYLGLFCRIITPMLSFHKFPSALLMMICELTLASICAQVLNCLFITCLHRANKTRSPVRTSYLLGESVHLLLSRPTFLSHWGPPILPPPEPNAKAALSSDNWVPRSSPSAPDDVRDAWPPNTEMDQKCPYVSMACISHKPCRASH